MSKTFIEHLAAAAARPVNAPAFMEGYHQSLSGVARGGRFQLYGLTIDVPEGVYPPHETSSTRFVLDHFLGLGLEQPGGTLLEIGCGAGAISLMAARKGWNVLAGDIDAEAVQATRRNAALNGLNVDVRKSDLFSAFEGERFNVILFNLPFFHPDREVRTDERTLSDAGGGIYTRFMSEARRYLHPGGYVIFTFSNCSNTSILNQLGWDVELRAFDFDAVSDYIRAIFKAWPF